jgi:MFS family permease
VAASGLIAYASAAVTARAADEGARVALILLALDRFHHGGTAGLLVACLMIPHIVAAPLVGALTDRARRPFLAIGATVLGFATALAVTAITLGREPLGVSLLVLLLGGSCGPAITGGLSSQVARLTTPQARPRAFGLDALTYNLAGPGRTRPRPAHDRKSARGRRARTAVRLAAAYSVARRPPPPSRPRRTRRPARSGTGARSPQ